LEWYLESLEYGNQSKMMQMSLKTYLNRRLVFIKNKTSPWSDIQNLNAGGIGLEPIKQIFKCMKCFLYILSKIRTAGSLPDGEEHLT